VVQECQQPTHSNNKSSLIEQLHATIGRDDPMEPDIPILHHMPQLPVVADPMVHNKIEEGVQLSTDLHNDNDSSSSANCSYKSRNIPQKLLAAISNKAVCFLLSLMKEQSEQD
jgi:hypothetical protein